jgi:Zn-dependent metalloprotease
MNANPASTVFCGIVPPHLLDRLARTGPPALAGAARGTLERDAAQRTRRHLAAAAVFAAPAAAPAAAPEPERTIHDAGNSEDLPGEVVRREGGAPSRDASVNRAYDGLGATFALFADAYGRDSIDGAGLPLDATVHYGRDYANAFWDGERMVFGDGDGEMFRDFTLSLDVIGHELAHGFTQYTANLRYSGQSGALNESVSDVFGSLVKQHELGQSAEEADWLIGADLFTDEVEGRALRSMKAPGTAYDDDVLGKDPQPGHMDDFVRTTADNGGVHINSGIPNRAFHLFATALGGNAWENAGRVWYDTLTAGSLTPDTDFAQFAAATLDAARERFGEGDEHKAVRAAWKRVGVTPAGGTGAA